MHAPHDEKLLEKKVGHLMDEVLKEYRGALALEDDDDEDDEDGGWSAD